MKPRIYIETTVFSYLTARPSHNVIAQARQELTRLWWNLEREKFELYASQLVVREAEAGDRDAAALRLQVMDGIPLLDITNEVNELAQRIIQPGMLPQRYFEDALHVALAVANGMQYLVTWNCTHIANATIRNRYEPMIRLLGYQLPIICTPEELFSETNDAEPKEET